MPLFSKIIPFRRKISALAATITVSAWTVLPKTSADAPFELSEFRLTSPAIDWPTALAQHDRWLRTVVLARLQERQAIDEVMQEVALAVVRGTAELLDPQKIAPWLYRVAVTQALLFRRKCGRARKLTREAGPLLAGEQLRKESLSPLTWLLAAERQQLVQKAMELLVPKDRELLLLKYSENWTYRQMAAHLGLSEATLETRLHRAREKLRQALARWQLGENA